MGSINKEGCESRLVDVAPPEKRPRIESGDGGDKTICEGGEDENILEYDYEYSDCDDGVIPMPREVYEKYCRQVEESEGFEVDDFSQYSQPVFGMFTRVDIDDIYGDLVIPFAESAIQQFNEKENANFVFVRLVTLTARPVRGINMYATFEAKDADGQIKTFQALVLLTPGFEENELEFWRLKPTPTKMQGSGNEQVGQGTTCC